MVLAAFIVCVAAGNLAILVASTWAQHTSSNRRVSTVAGVTHLRVVDDRVLRSSAPSRDAYFELAQRGVRTVVDLRAEDDVRDDEVFLTGLGVRLIRIPIRDGQTPTTAQVDQFLGAIRSSEGTVLVHCGTGVGRTGTMAAAYLVGSGAATPRTALWRNLAVGPPSLEQISYVAGLANGFAHPGFAVRALSRTLDAPRRLWSRFRSRTDKAHRGSRVTLVDETRR